MSALQLGLLLPSRDLAARGEHDVTALVGLAHRAEELGFDSVWTGDSPLARPRADALTLLSAVAAVTHRVAIGTAVLLPALRHPILLAHQLATIDRLSHGRLIVGVGAGFPYSVTQEQFERLGVPYRGRVGRMVDSIEALRRLFADDPAEYGGTHYSFSGVRLAPRPVSPDGPPIWLAGGGERSLQRIGRIGDGWLPYPPDPTAYTAGLATIEQAAAAAGRPGAVTPGLYATVCLDDDPARARALLRTSIERYYSAPLETVEQLQALFSGTPEQCVAWLREYTEAGARQVILRLAVENHASALEQLAEEVLPALRPVVTR
jgi:probable F420-dependent oxidoreductase